MVQIDVRVPPGTSPVEEDLTVARRNIEEYRSLAGQTPPPDLAVWGEGALDPGALTDPATVAAVRAAIAEVGVPTTVGAVVNDPDGAQRTSVLAFDAGGGLVDRYDKVHLVPFGEYVPWRRYLSWISAIEQIPVDRTPGTSVHTITQPGLPSYGTPICFENAFPDIERTMVREGAQFFVVPVNNASYGFTAAAEQHLQMSRMRAVETGRWVVDAAVSGISAFIDTDGQVLSNTQLFVPGILRGQVRPSTVWTLYVRYGDWFPVVCLVIVAMSFLFAPRRRTARSAPEPLPRPLRGLAVLPTYEERGTIEQAIRGVLAADGIDVLVVDDSSPDGTGQLVAEIAATEARVRLVERPAKSGLASAYLDGFHTAIAEGYDIAIEMDSDLSHDPTELPGLLAAARALRPRGREPVRPRGVRHRLEPITGGPVAGGQRLRAVHAGVADPRRHKRVPGVPARVARRSAPRSVRLGRLRVPDRARVTGAPAGLRGRRGADHVPGTRVRRVEDLPGDRCGSLVEGHPVGLGPSVPYEAASLTGRSIRNAHNARYVTLSEVGHAPHLPPFASDILRFGPGSSDRATGSVDVESQPTGCHGCPRSGGCGRTPNGAFLRPMA